MGDKLDGNVTMNPYVVCVAGALSSVVPGTVLHPLERVRAFMQVDTRMYQSTWVGLQQILRTQGMHGLMQGNLIKCLRLAPNSALRFWAYEHFKATLSQLEHASPMHRRVIAGGLAGLLSTAVLHPMELLQTHVTLARKQGGKSLGTWNLVTESFRKLQGTASTSLERWTSMWRGCLVSMVGSIPYTGLSMAGYENIKHALMKNETDCSAQKAFLIRCIAGAGSGSAAMILTYPLDTVRRRIQMAGTPGYEHFRYKNSWHCFKSILRHEGFAKGLMAGSINSLLQTVPRTAATYVLFDGIIQAYVKATHLPPTTQDHDDPVLVSDKETVLTHNGQPIEEQARPGSIEAPPFQLPHELSDESSLGTAVETAPTTSPLSRPQWSATVHTLAEKEPDRTKEFVAQSVRVTHHRTTATSTRTRALCLPGDEKTHGHELTVTTAAIVAPPIPFAPQHNHRHKHSCHSTGKGTERRAREAELRCEQVISRWGEWHPEFMKPS